MDFEHTLKSLLPEWSVDPLPEINGIIKKGKLSLVVLDDDPTGTQTVYDIPVLTEWSTESIHKEFQSKTPLFYILTNSRALQERDAIELAREIGRNLTKASSETGRGFRVISRSDSTLRGHYPAEVDALEQQLDKKTNKHIIIPFFFEGGRLTIEDIHYVREGNNLIPAAETSFAQDATFGYKSSNLKEWVEEKSKGKISRDSVGSITIQDIRAGGPSKIADILTHSINPVIVVNSVTQRDAEVIALGMLMAEQRGASFIMRSAASIVSALGGLKTKPILSKEDLNISNSGGSLTIVGSYQPKSSRQLEHLLQNADCHSVLLDVKNVLSEESTVNYIQQTTDEINKALSAEKNVVIYTSRELVTSASPEKSLDIVTRVSSCLVDIVGRLKSRPRFIISKGGITSSDVATKSLKTKRATVLGQILPGVPVWRLDSSSKFPNMVYIVFPGNVGEVESMTGVVQKLMP
ncbi:MAG: hypothetical protein O2887_15160 [Bacteroidetes bacterium]|nr:hypothetical protein [Bacteroidota bacterium]MDA1121803.1 hypothetical protein [Bacteroidota bacterium]